jgi:hypothetical protein
MKKQLAIVAGVILTLGTAVSATLNSEAQPVQPAMTVESGAAKQSVQIVALWKTHATSSGSVPLARPL